MRSRRLAAVAAWTLMTVLVSGCSDDEADGPQDPGASGSATTSPTADGSGDASSGTPSASQVEPATGQLVTMRSGISFRLTEGPDWGVIGEGGLGVAADAEAEGTLELLILDGSEFDAVTEDLEVAANATLKSLPESSYPTLRREEDREVNGVTGYVLRSEDDAANYYLFGALHKGIAFSLSMEVPLELELEDWIEPILASIEWP